MRAVDSDLAAAIYSERFADPIPLHDLPAGVDYRLLDIAVNLGLTGGIHLLQDVLGEPHGVMTDATIAKAKAAACQNVARHGSRW